MTGVRCPTDIDRHIGQRIRMARWEAVLSQTALGDEVGIAFQQVQKYENGTSRVAASRLWDIAGVLKVPVAYFFEGIPAR